MAAVLFSEHPRQQVGKGLEQLVPLGESVCPVEEPHAVKIQVQQNAVPGIWPALGLGHVAELEEVRQVGQARQPVILGRPDDALLMQRVVQHLADPASAVLLLRVRSLVHVPDMRGPHAGFRPQMLPPGVDDPVSLLSGGPAPENDVQLLRPFGETEPGSGQSFPVVGVNVPVQVVVQHGDCLFPAWVSEQLAESLRNRQHFHRMVPEPVYGGGQGAFLQRGARLLRNLLPPAFPEGPLFLHEVPVIPGLILKHLRVGPGDQEGRILVFRPHGVSAGQAESAPSGAFQDLRQGLLHPGLAAGEEQQDELVAADPIRPDVLAAGAAEAGSDLFQRLIPGTEAFQVVQLFQAVHIQGCGRADAFPQRPAVFKQGLPVQQPRQRVPSDVIGAEKQIEENGADQDGGMQPHAAVGRVQKGGGQAQQRADRQGNPVCDSFPIAVPADRDPEDGRQIPQRHDEGHVSQRSPVKGVFLVKAKGDVGEKRRGADQQVDRGGDPVHPVSARRFQHSEKEPARGHGPKHVSRHGQQRPPEPEIRIPAADRLEQILKHEQEAAHQRKPEIVQLLVPDGALGAQAKGKQDDQKQGDKVFPKQFVQMKNPPREKRVSGSGFPPPRGGGKPFRVSFPVSVRRKGAAPQLIPP